MMDEFCRAREIIQKIDQVAVSYERGTPVCMDGVGAGQ